MYELAGMLTDATAEGLVDVAWTRAALAGVKVSLQLTIVVMLEQVVGLFYVAMVVTRLVALRGQRASGRQS